MKTDNNISKTKTIDVIAIQSKVWLNTDEAANYTGLSRTEINRLRLHGTKMAGTLPYVKIKNSVRFKRTEIDKFMEQHTVKSTA